MEAYDAQHRVWYRQMESTNRYMGSKLRSTGEHLESVTAYWDTPGLNDAATLRKLLSKISEASWIPTKWSLREKGGLPYSMDDVLAHLEQGVTVYLRRSIAPKYELRLRKSSLRWEYAQIPADMLAAQWVLTRDIALLAMPEFGVVTTTPVPPTPGYGLDPRREVEWESGLMSVLHNAADADGLIGLAPRTIIGPRLTSLLGREVLLGIPGVNHYLMPNGGVILELSDAPWSLSLDELIEIRRPATAYLRARGLLSVPTTSVWPGRTDRVIVDWRPGPNYPAERIVR